MQVSQSNASIDAKNLYESAVICISLSLLIASCIDQGIIGGGIKLFWLASLATVSIFNLGAAVGLYVFSVAIYAVRHYQGWGSVLERPDNFALGIILISYAFTHLRKDFFSRIGYLGIAIGVLVFFALFQMVALSLVTRENFAWFMRMLGLPLILFSMLAGAFLSYKDAREFTKIMMILGTYMAGISILERIGWYSILIPNWIADSTLNVTIGIGRSGGLLLQSEWNGFALGLIFCIILGRFYIDKTSSKLMIFIAGTLSLFAIYFTYTRAAWLAVAFAISLMATKFSPTLKGKYIRGFVIIIAGIFLLGLIGIFPVKMAQERLGDESTISYRIKLWTAGLRMVAQKPVFGHGFGQFKEKVLLFHETEAENVPSRLMGNPVAHNTLIDIVVELGLLGLILYLVIFSMIYLRARKSYAATWGKDSTNWVTAFMLVYLINSQFVVAHEPTNNIIYYSMMGILIGLRSDGIDKRRLVCKSPIR